MFKPEPRSHSAQRVFEQALGSLAGVRVPAAVMVGAEPVHGSLATVSIHGIAEENRSQIEAQVRERMSPFVMCYRIGWL